MASDERIVPGLGGYLGYPVSVEGVRKQLAILGLHVVTDADMRVLEAMADMTQASLLRGGPLQSWRAIGENELIEAELARREVKSGA